MIRKLSKVNSILLASAGLVLAGTATAYAVAPTMFGETKPSEISNAEVKALVDTSETPTASPTPKPTATPTPKPTKKPTVTPAPTLAPTAIPTAVPTAIPTAISTAAPVVTLPPVVITPAPTLAPTAVPITPAPQPVVIVTPPPIVATPVPAPPVRQVPVVVSSNTYYGGYCTWYAKNRRPDLPNSLGNADTWLSRAAAAGFATGSTPQVGAIAYALTGYMHVAYVEAVHSDGTITVSEMNFAGFDIISTRTAPANQFSYIY